MKTNDQFHDLKLTSLSNNKIKFEKFNMLHAFKTSRELTISHNRYNINLTFLFIINYNKSRRITSVNCKIKIFRLYQNLTVLGSVPSLSYNSSIGTLCSSISSSCLSSSRFSFFLVFFDFFLPPSSPPGVTAYL